MHCLEYGHASAVLVMKVSVIDQSIQGNECGQDAKARTPSEPRQAVIGVDDVKQ